MYDKQITVFNSYMDNSEKKWKATRLSDVDFSGSLRRGAAQYGESSADSIKCLINGFFDAEKGFYTHDADGEIITLINPYFGRRGTVAFRSGEQVLDFVLPYIWDGDEVIDDGDYDEGFFNFANAEYGAFRVSSLSIYTLLPHLEVGLL